MADFTKKYYHPKNEMDYLSVLWDTGYRNVQIYRGERLIKSFHMPNVFVKGTQFSDEELGDIRVKFSSGSPKKLEIKVNKKKYITVNKMQYGYNFGGLIAVFTGLAVFAGIGLMVFLGVAEFDLEHPVVRTVFFTDIAIITIYGITSYLLSKRKTWVYFIGTGVFLVTSAIAVFTESLYMSSILANIMLIPRLVILVYVLSQIKNIINEIQRVQGKSRNNQLLDH